MNVITAIGITIAFILVVFIIPSWVFNSLDRGGSHNIVLKIIQSFLAEIIFGFIATLFPVFFIAIGWTILDLIFPFIGSGKKWYGIIALCIFSLCVLYALFKLFYTVFIICKYPGFKEYYMNQGSYFNMGKGDFKEYQNNKKQWGIVHRTSPKKLLYGYFYAVLELESSASIEEVKRAYHLKAQQYHPDKFFNASEYERNVAENRFKEIKNAYEQIMKIKKINP